MSVASSLSSIAEKLTSVLSKINKKLVEKGATEAATFNDVDSKLDEISTGNISVDGSFQVVAVDGAAYGFEKQADEYWQSTNKGVSSSCSVCKVVFNMNTDGTAVFDCINYAEAKYDYGVIGNVDTELSTTNINDVTSNIAKSFKDSNSSSVQTYSMVIPSGEHFVYVKYRKDNNKDENDDMFKFKVSIDSSAATSADILYGKKAYVNGALVEGTIQTKTGQQGSTITSNGTTSIPQGYHDGGSYVSVNVSTTTANGALGEPSISINASTGVITATSNVRTSGYLSTSATSSNTYTLPTNSGGTITPGTSQKTAVAAGKYTTAATYVAGDSNLVAANIKNGVSIFGVNGTYAGSGGSYASVQTLTSDITPGYHYLTITNEVFSDIASNDIVAWCICTQAITDVADCNAGEVIMAWCDTEADKVCTLVGDRGTGVEGTVDTYSNINYIEHSKSGSVFRVASQDLTFAGIYHVVVKYKTS